MEKKILVLLVFCLFLRQAFAQTSKSFEAIWQQFNLKSLNKKASELDRDVVELSLTRAERHWLPRVYGSAQWFNTNDPTQVFFSNLGQRSIEQTDFLPRDLNHPGRRSFNTGTLGLDLPLYEGGQKRAQLTQLRTLLQAADWELKAIESKDFTELSLNYGALLVSLKNTLYLSELQKALDKIINSYQVGSQRNPVGYSGLLGLKGVKNRIEGSLYELNLSALNAKTWINTKIESSDNWVPDINQDVIDFLQRHLSSPSSGVYSSLLLAQEHKVNSLSAVTAMERSRFLPRVGLFALNNLYSGDRDTENAQAFGLYLAWDIFNSDSFGRVSEAHASNLAQEAKVKAHKQEEKMLLEQLLSTRMTLEKSLALVKQSDEILREQSQNAMKLFRSGLLSGLQLAEVINRRVDLIENKYKVENQMLTVYAKIYQLNH
jgi:outer membrane protein TolC